MQSASRNSLLLTPAPAFKHRLVFDALRQEIESGRWHEGHRLPSEADLVKQFGVSRITIWGGFGPDGSIETRAWQLCRQYVERRVSGVFFAPLEAAPGKDEVNLRIARAFDAARIPIVLLDRPLLPYPHLDHHDVVGIDNRRAGYDVTSHLLAHGCRRVAFVAPPHAAATAEAREAGYREALWLAGAAFDPALAERFDPSDAMAIKALMDRQRPDGIVCVNGRTAALLMPTLLQLGHRIPQDVRLAGIDDVEYARLLPVPLTTLRQPTHQIGEIALTVMLERLQRRDLPARQVLLSCDLVVRASCGTHARDPRPGEGGDRQPA